jgi:hypothetical protein
VKVTTDIRKSTPVLAVIGVTDLAGHALRTVRSELHPAKLQENAQNVPNLAISKALQTAGRAEQTYSDLALRGRAVVNSVRRGSAHKDLLKQSRSTLTLGKAAVTTIRKAGDDTLVAAKATLTSGRREGAALVGSAAHEVQTEAKSAVPAAKKATKSTRSSAKRTVTTARKRTATAKKATKATRTSARKTTAKAATATKSAASRTGR